ncbi:penicillin acylase family protein [Alteromonas sp. CYL-A6]|uniref:penicillin acylase family protein n=1 Tax=Alteromonas nitratireducens TaxID=3390813 RepID=UPI0034B2DDBC
MQQWIKWTLVSLIGLIGVAMLVSWLLLRASLPVLDGESQSSAVRAPVSLARDTLGQAVIQANDRQDAAFALGFAHGQDRFFQMDLQRRAAAGGLSEWVGPAALSVDKRARFHQFRKRAAQVIEQLPDWQRVLLQRYADGVNAALTEMAQPPFEYLLSGMAIRPWQVEDSILVVFSMYLDLQRSQVDMDMARTVLASEFGQPMLNFIMQPTRYQAALDDSWLETGTVKLPPYPLGTQTASTYDYQEPPDIGSNNWAVTGALTDNQGALLANDMHLTLRVPIIWYRAQLNYRVDDTAVQLTGVSLPGLPGIVVGTNGKVAWGFTNANLDTVDWVRLPDDVRTWEEQEFIAVGDGDEIMTLTVSEFGPVRDVDGERFALSWVAHQPYAVNLAITQLDTAKTVDDAIALASSMGIPTQNMMLADADGNAAWTPAGALPARPHASDIAISPAQYSEAWAQVNHQRPVVKNPPQQRLWTANARVISTQDLATFGDGGYALGARGYQIKQRLFERERFSETEFYAIQLDNKADFLVPWHDLLLASLATEAETFSDDIRYLKSWQACACAESVGYTLVRHFRSSLTEMLMGNLFNVLEDKDVNTAPLLRQIEPALWQLLSQQPDDWLPDGFSDYTALIKAAYRNARDELLATYGKENGLADLTWGRVNALRIAHPFARQIPLLGDLLNMQETTGFGDSYMPAVQKTGFGASERFFVQPGHLKNAILTLPGGQSGHPLSPFYQAGYSDYINNAATPLLPQKLLHKRAWLPATTE